MVNINGGVEGFLDRYFGGEEEKLIKSKSRVAENGEVFTPRWCVRDMCDLEGVKECTYSLDKTFLEPACGNGNFLIQILARKLSVASEETLDLDVVKSVATIYGVDIDSENIKESRERMTDIINQFYSEQNKEIPANINNVVKYILEHNIILGNTLSGKKIDPMRDSGESDDFMVFSEWNFDGDMVTRKDYLFSDLNTVDIEYEPKKFSMIHRVKDKKSRSQGNAESGEAISGLI